MLKKLALLSSLSLITAFNLPVYAEREPVLKQINVPHNYYYREMYLPQLTSGPSSPTWSPDGKEIIYSMQGSLWRQKINSKEAVQLTSGPGYDYQPDWSPDSKYLVYSSYRNDALQLMLLELSSGKSTVLLADGAVNIEPKWSPDGKKIAFVSTIFNGRWHIFTAAFNGNKLDNIQRISAENDSKLPRYYYSVFDHYISPSWSPDGKEIIFVSNKNHIWGSGGFWRMEAKAGAVPKEIYYEETTWKARPDWAADGRRVVYSSYLGRQWNQLWLMTKDGGDPIQLTYGDFDATNPRWSDDGKHIAYISNEGGNTSLWLLDIPGGYRRKLEINKFKYLENMANLKISVIDEKGKPVPARLSVTAKDGRSFSPANSLRHADDYYDRKERKFEYNYFHTKGITELMVPPGQVNIEVMKGFEYAIEKKNVNVLNNSNNKIIIKLKRLTNYPAAGWYSGDLHVHMNYGGSYRNTPANLAFQAQAEDLHVVENLIVNKEQRIPDISYFRTSPDPVSAKNTLINHSQEFHTSFWGHIGILGLNRNLLLPDYSGYVNTGVASIYPSNADILDLAHQQGALGGYVHPFDTYPDPATENITNELPVDVALGKVDYMEVVGFSDHLSTAKVWYQLLNCGFKLPTGSGSDTMANYASLRGHVGMNRVYVKTGTKLDHKKFLAGLKAGKTFATNGPVLEFTLESAEIGDTIYLSKSKKSLKAKVKLRSIVPIEHFEIVSNGKVISTIPINPDQNSADAVITIPVEKSGWFTLRAWSKGSVHPVLDLYPFATTSPIYVIANNQPIRSPQDAEYFLAWIAKLETSVKGHKGWNTDQEKAHILNNLELAKKEFLRRK